jgi:hypothetical protein
MIRLILISWFFISGLVITGQITFTDNQFYEVVLKNHPLAKQARLETKFGEKAILSAQGGFDPKAYTQSLQKNFNSTAYYNLLNAGLKVPTWYGLEFKGGFESNQGSYLNPLALKSVLKLASIDSRFCTCSPASTTSISGRSPNSAVRFTALNRSVAN